MRRSKMNKKDNRLTRETDEKIIRSVYFMMTKEHRPISRITVREICEQADIHRSTFYAHYRDVYDLVERVEQNMSRHLTEAFLRKLDEGAPARECFIEILTFICDHSEFYLYYLTESGNSGVLQLAWNMISERFSSVLPERFGVSTYDEMKFHGAFFLFGLTAVVRLWLQDGCREKPEELYDIIRRQGSVQNAMTEW